MVSVAITALKERNGSSQYAIQKFIEEKHKQLPSNFRKLLLVSLRKFVASGKLVKVKGSYKLPAARSSALKSESTPPKKPKAAMVVKSKAKVKAVVVKPKAKAAMAKPKTAAKLKTAVKAKVAVKTKSAAVATRTKRKAVTDVKEKPMKVAKMTTKSMPTKSATAVKKAAPLKKAMVRSMKSPWKRAMPKRGVSLCVNT